MSITIDEILPRLSKVKGRNGRFSACCPAHEDSSPSLAIRETEDGTILMHCFGGCTIGSIADALGIDLSDLFPPTDNGQRAKARGGFYATDLLRVIGNEALIVAVAAHGLARGTALTDVDRARLLVATQRINEAMELANV